MQVANRVVINTVVHYIQLFLNVVIGLVSVRLILAALGRVDYGVYDVVGGIVSLLSFISSSLGQASMRFISVSLGKNDTDDIRNTFCSCFWLHVSFAIVLSALVEFVGLFLFDGFLEIPTDRVSAAKKIYHIVTFTLFLGITLSPFRALINSHEKYWYTSIIGILNSVLKLLIAIIITFWFSDKLIAYGFLLALVSIVDFVLIAGYAFSLYRNQMSFKRTSFGEMRNMLSFMGWTILDVLGSTLNRQGYAVMLNRFFGPVTNTTFALARQLEGHMYSISASALGTMKPQIMKSYGAGDNNRMFRLSLTAGKIGCMLMSIVCVPLIVMMPDVLSIWLKDYPEKTVLFARLMILACMIEQMTRGLVFANQAVGNIKWFSIIVSAIRMSALPISWVLLMAGLPDYVSIIVFFVCESIGSFSRPIILSRISDFNSFDFFKQVLFRLSPPIVIAFAVCIIMYRFVSGLFGLIVTLIVTVCVYCGTAYWWGLSDDEKDTLIGVWESFYNQFAANKKGA